jgi:hypothetical protein
MILFIVLQIVSFGWIVFIQVSQNLRDDADLRNHLQTSNVQQRLLFCLDNAIRPCDDIAIQQWNLDHPENTFLVK